MIDWSIKIHSLWNLIYWEQTAKAFRWCTDALWIRYWMSIKRICV